MNSYFDIDEPYASSSKFTIPTSSIRDEPRGQSSSTAPRHDPLNRLVPDSPRYRFDPQYAHYLKPRSYKVVDGLQSDGTLTTDHPLVSHYLKQLKSVSPEAGRTENEKWWTKGIRQPTVDEVLDLENIDLDEYQSDCIFTLAALRVLKKVNHPKHFALWGKEWAQRTADRVHKVLREYSAVFRPSRLFPNPSMIMPRTLYPPFARHITPLSANMPQSASARRFITLSSCAELFLVPHAHLLPSRLLSSSPHRHLPFYAFLLPMLQVHQETYVN